MAKNKVQQEQILLKNSDINIFLPENIKAGSNILIFGNIYSSKEIIIKNAFTRRQREVPGSIRRNQKIR